MSCVTVFGTVSDEHLKVNREMKFALCDITIKICICNSKLKINSTNLPTRVGLSALQDGLCQG